MCMRDTKEACILIERMAKVEAKTEFNTKLQWVNIALLVFLFIALVIGFFKLLDSQIYMLTGERGLRTISDEARNDVQRRTWQKLERITGELIWLTPVSL